MKKSSKLLSLLLAAVMLFGVMAGTFTASAAGGLNTADFVVFGSYNGVPITWRVINVDDNGALLFSEKILTLKAFDAAEKTESVPQDYPNVGNNYWASSNIRDWLNSSAQGVSFSANAPVQAYVENGYNDYATEAGFLAGFTAEERALIKQTNQKNALDMLSYQAANEGGNQLLKYDSSFSNMMQNYAECYKMNTSEKVFLLDIEQLYNYVYMNGFGLAKRPTASAVTLSEYKSELLNADKPWKYWLRTPRTEDNSSARINYFGNNVLDDTAWNGTVGVAPALYINTSAPIAGGSGTYADPYVVSGSGYKFYDLGGYSAQSDAIYTLASKGVINGYADGSFRPGTEVSRADFVLMLMRALGQTGTVTKNFSDVASDAYYYNAVGQAKLRGYIGGDGTGSFNPDAGITVQDMYLIAARALAAKNNETIRYREGQLQNYLDSIYIAGYAQDAVSWLLQKGIVSGNDGRICPRYGATRADCAQLIFSILGNIN